MSTQEKLLGVGATLNYGEGFLELWHSMFWISGYAAFLGVP